MATDLLAGQFNNQQPIDLLAGVPSESNELSWRQGKPQSFWNGFDNFFGMNTEKEKARAANALTYSEMLNISPKTAYDNHDEISAQVKEKLSTEKIITEKKGIGEAAQAGIDNSILGLLSRQQVPKPFESASQVERWVNGFTTMAYDLPFFLAGMTIGGGPTTVSGWAGSFGLPAGIRQVLVDRYTKGEMRDFPEFLDRTGRAIKETIKGQIVGGLTGMAGMVSPVGYKALSELATMTAAGKLIEGHVPTAKDFVDNAAMLIAMHMGIKGQEIVRTQIPEIRTKLKEAFVEDGITPKMVSDKVLNDPVIDTESDIAEVVDKVIADLKAEQLPKEQIKEEAKKERQEVPKPQPTGETSTKNAIVDLEREARGEEKIEHPSIKRATLEEVKEKVDSGELDVLDEARKINNIVDSGEPVPAGTEELQFAFDYAAKKLQNREYEVNEAIKEAEKEGRSVPELEAEKRRLRYEQDVLDKAKVATGSAWSNVGTARQQMMAEDYSFTALVRRAREDGVEITPEVEKQLDTISQKIKKAQKKVDEFEAEKEGAKVDKTIKILQNEEALKQRKEKRQVKKEELDAEFDSLAKAFSKQVSGLSANRMFDPEAHKFMIQMARNRIQKGVVTAEGIVDEIYTSLKNLGLEYSKREIRDDISQYGVQRELSKNEIDVKLREAKRQMRLISALEDARKGIPPEKSGLKWDEQSEEVRELTKQVKAAMRESGIDERSTKSPEEQWKSSLDAVKTRLKNQITDLEKYLETFEKPTAKEKGIKYDEEALALKDVRDALKGVMEWIEGKPEMSAEQRVRQATTAVEKSIKEYERRITEGDLAPKKKESKTPETPELKELREKRDALKEILKAMREEAKPKLTPEQQAEKAFITRTKNQIKEYERRIAEGDYSTKPQKEVRQLSEKELEVKFKLDQAKREYVKMRLDHLAESKTGMEKARDWGIEAINLMRAIKTSFDLSGLLRQGGLLIAGDPTLAPEAMRGMMKALSSKEGEFAVNKAIQERANYHLYEKGKLYLAEHGMKLSEMEEVYMSRWAEKVPGVAASQRAYTTVLNVIRANKFDILLEKLAKDGKNPTKEELLAIGRFVNEFTGRGTVEGREMALVGANTIFFAPRYVLSRFQVLLGHSMWGGTARTRTLIAQEYAKTFTGLAVVLGMGLAMGAVLETDPRSSDFLKLRLGNTRVDFFAGLSQSAVLMSRVWSEQTKTTRGKIIPLSGETVPYGGSDVSDVLWRFIRTKFSPVIGTAVDVKTGKDVVGNKVTMYDIPEKMVFPLAIGDVFGSMKEQGVPMGTALGILALFGVGMYTFDPRKKQVGFGTQVAKEAGLL